ncbi:hypothetical protein XENOCAPTIV_029857, partial [Xenoophorus captivus]
LSLEGLHRACPRQILVSVVHAHVVKTGRVEHFLCLASRDISDYPADLASLFVENVFPLMLVYNTEPGELLLFHCGAEVQGKPAVCHTGQES